MTNQLEKILEAVDKLSCTARPYTGALVTVGAAEWQALQELLAPVMLTFADVEILSLL
jgi:hypothetical protein